MKLNIGAGKKLLYGYTSVDVEPLAGAPEPDIRADARSIPLPDNSVEEIIAIHVVEHFYRWEADDVFREWHRLLQPGGRLIVELPDIVKAARNLLEGPHAGEQLHMWAFYGDPRHKNPLMCHKWGWSAASLMPVLKLHGFGHMVEKETLFHSVGRRVRDFRLEALKMIK